MKLNNHKQYDLVIQYDNSKILIMGHRDIKLKN